MDDTTILQQVRQWVRIRNALRAAIGALLLLLGASLLCRLGGGTVPSYVWFAVPILAGTGWAWPLFWERLFLWAGRRLGVGERLAAVDVLLQRQSRVLVGPLLREVASARRRLWRLAVGPLEVGASVLSVGLAVAVGLVPPPAGSPAQAPAVSPDTEMAVGTVSSSEPAAEPLYPAPGDAPAVYPASAEVPAYSPYQDLLAAILGVDESMTDGLFGDELVGRLAAEEGLLRQLAERLAAAGSGGGSSSERAELAALAREVARPDLRERLEDLLGQEGDAAVREAAEAVDAVLDAADRARTGDDPDADPHAPGLPGAGPAVATDDAGTWEGDELHNGLPFPGFLDGDDLLAGGEERVDIPGAGVGDPLHPGPAGEWAVEQTDHEATPIAGDEGPLRAYIVPAVPGEPPEAPGAPRDILSPPEVEVVLRVRGIPAELRDVVRRYFELIGGNP